MRREGFPAIDCTDTEVSWSRNKKETEGLVGRHMPRKNAARTHRRVMALTDDWC